MLLALKILELKGFIVYSLPFPTLPIPQPLKVLVLRLVETHIRLLRVTTSFKDDGYKSYIDSICSLCENTSPVFTDTENCKL